VEWLAGSRPVDPIPVYLYADYVDSTKTITSTLYSSATSTMTVIANGVGQLICEKPIGSFFRSCYALKDFRLKLKQDSLNRFNAPLLVFKKLLFSGWFWK